MAINFTKAFTVLGSIFKTTEQVNVAIGTTLPTYLQHIQNQFTNNSPTSPPAPPYAAIAGKCSTDGSAWQSSAGSLNSPLAGDAQTYIQRLVLDDNPQLAGDFKTAITEFIRQMIFNSGGTLAAPNDSVRRNGPPTATVTQPIGTSDAAVLTSIYLLDGRNAENILPENIYLTCTSQATTRGGAATLSVVGQAKVSSDLSYQYPLGSATNTTQTTLLPSNSLLTNSGFDSFSSADSIQQNIPDGWVFDNTTDTSAGGGVTVIASTVSVHSLTIGGTVTAGYFNIVYTDDRGKKYQTTAIAWNAGASTLQSALQALPGLSAVTVAVNSGTPGTGASWVFYITMTGVPGDTRPGGSGSCFACPSVLDLTGSAPAVTGASVTTGTMAYSVVSGTASRAVALAGTASGSAQRAIIYQPVTLTASTLYGFMGRFAMDASTLAGVVTISLVDGISGSTINDDLGNANSFTVSFSQLNSSTFTALGQVFRTPKSLPAIVYFKVAVTTAITSGKKFYLDHFVFAAMSPLYTGGPAVQVFSGDGYAGNVGTGVNLKTGDQWKMVMANTLSNSAISGFQSWFDRCFGLKALGLQLPSKASSESQPDSLIA